MSELDEAMSLVHVGCMDVHVVRLRAAIITGNWMEVRRLLCYITEEVAEVEQMAERLAPGAIPTTAEDTDVLPVEEAPTLTEWSYVVTREV